MGAAEQSAELLLVSPVGTTTDAQEPSSAMLGIEAAPPAPQDGARLQQHVVGPEGSAIAALSVYSSAFSYLNHSGCHAAKAFALGKYLLQ